MNLKNMQGKTNKLELPLVPLRELVVFPHMVVPFFAGRPASIKAIEEAMARDRIVFLACQKTNTESPTENDIYTSGVTAKILQMLKLPDGTVRILAEGQRRGKILRFIKRKESMHVSIHLPTENRETNSTLTALMLTSRQAFLRYTKFQKKISKDIVESIENAEYPEKLVDLITANVNIKPDKKIEILKTEDIEESLETLSIILEAENEVLSIQNKINSKVQKKLEKNQKEYFLNEQIRQINKELGKNDDDQSEAEDLRKRIQLKNPPQEVLEKSEKELKRLEKLQAMSPESGVLRTYLEWIADLPWSTQSKDNHDIKLAEKILNEDHFDMIKPKERVLDFIAVHQLKESMKGPILCFVGPPGTGKTSLGRSVARALNREFIRISLGGVRDEAEIRGHRKTYVGALPGKILQSLKKAGTTNPVFLLDEIDKMNSDFKGDPSSALLEVLDPEQNSTFVDHYLELPYDLSKVMFITTANSVSSIPLPLRDRMEVIETPGYTDLEKEKIASSFIIPKQIKENGLDWATIKFQKTAILDIIRNYTMESGVRNLEREIGAVVRKIARKAVTEGYTNSASDEGKKEFKATISTKNLHTFIGNEKFNGDLVYNKPRPGLAHGLAWTEMGGRLLPVEVALLKGSGKLILTGSLGDVMKESAQIGLSFIRAHNEEFGIDADFQKEIDIHIHVPHGAIPKDGPSAGISLSSAMLSALTKKPILEHTAMTGEITLTGRVLAIGGVKEKVLAAYRNNMTTVLLPAENMKDIEELPKEVKGKINFVFASSVKEALITLFPDSFLS
ncbi:MAG: endopeptidase La [Spirochaetia bacterium]|jgi:ATP-dependent Lon protease|nr:endopeptidase La [Spirochaetia bacterium]